MIYRISTFAIKRQRQQTNTLHLYIYRLRHKDERQLPILRILFLKKLNIIAICNIHCARAPCNEWGTAFVLEIDEINKWREKKMLYDDNKITSNTLHYIIVGYIMIIMIELLLNEIDFNFKIINRKAIPKIICRKLEVPY